MFMFECVVSLNIYKDDSDYIPRNLSTCKSNMTPMQEAVIKIEKRDIHKCVQCTKAFLDLSDLEIHAEKHVEVFNSHLTSSYIKLEKVNIYSCDDCTQGFLNNKDCLLHKLKHIHKSVISARIEKTKLYNNKSIEKPFKCSECDYRFVAKSTLEAHLFVHQPFPHICICGVGYYQLKDLKSHQNLVKCKPSKITPLSSNTNSNFCNDTLDNHQSLAKGTPDKKENIKPKHANTHKTLKLHQRKMENIKLLNNNTNETTQGIIKVKLPFKITNKISNIKQDTNVCDWTLLPTLPLDIEIKKISFNKYQCPVCKKLIKSKKSVEQHFRTIHRKERAFLCNICQKRFSQQGAVEKHLLIHSGVKAFGCQYCDKRFIDKGALNLHERTHTGYKPFKCVFCDKCFSDPSAHNRHERIHTGEKRYSCEVCSKAFTDNSALYVHRKRHYPRNFSCDKCKKSFYTKSILNKHVKTVHNRILKFQCDHCGKCCSMKSNLACHIQAMHKFNRKTYKCHLCFNNFVGKLNLKKHILVVHDKVKKFTCPICCKQYYDKSVMKLHMLVHKNERSYECNDCPKKYNTRACILSHIQQKHLKFKFKCKLCLRKFSSQQNLEKHTLKEGKQCQYCEKILFCEGNFSKHLKTHMEVRFECDDCGDVFDRRIKIVRHISKYHIIYSKWRFQCEHCGQRFANKENIRSHMTTHFNKIRCKNCYKYFWSILEFKKHEISGCEKLKHACEVCSKKFSYISNLLEHKKKHLLKPQKFKCPMCKNKYSSRHSAKRHFTRVHINSDTD